MSELEADTVVILSSELISKIVGEYFNRKMFKESVEIVDLKPTETGYMFSVAFVPVKKVTPPVDQSGGFIPQVSGIDFMGNGVTNSVVGVRDSKGKFTKVKG